MSAKVYQIITDRIIAALEKGNVPWHRPWKGTDIPTNFVSKRAYRGMNVFLLSGTDYNSPYFLTYKQARTKGGKVKEGEKGFPVLFWNFLDKTDADTGEKTGKKIPFLRYYTVFNLEQTEGIDIPKVETPSNPVNPIESAEKIIAGMKTEAIVKFGGGRACYDIKGDFIRMPEKAAFDNMEFYYSTLFHEIGHWTGHPDRLDRPGITTFDFFGSHQYSKEELVAEMTSAFLCGMSGIENKTLDNSAAYLASWSKKLKEDNKLIVSASSQAQKAADYVLGNEFKSAEETEDVKEEIATA